MSDDEDMSEDERKQAPPARRNTKPMQRVRNQVALHMREVEEKARSSQRKRILAPLYLWRLLLQVLSQWKQDRCPQQAAALSFQSVLSVVPALALTMAAFRFTGAMEAESSLIQFLSREFLPLSAEEISEKLLRLSKNINFEAMGAVGLVSTLLIAFFAYNSLELSIHHIWRVEKRRSLPRRLLAFYLTATIGSILVGLSLYQSAQFGLSDGWSGALMSALIAFSAIFLANYFIPAIPVQARAALVGAVVTTVASEIAKMAFAAYVGGFAMDRYSGIYGPLAAVPLCLMWIYWSWLMLLLGVEVTHSVQNLRLLEGTERRVQLGLEKELQQHVSGRMGARVLAIIANAQAAGAVGLSRFRLAHYFALSEDAVRIITHRMRDQGLLQESSAGEIWSLSRAPEEISVLQVLDAFRGGSEVERLYFASTDKVDPEDEADARLLALVRQSRDAAQNCSIADLC